MDNSDRLSKQWFSEAPEIDYKTWLEGRVIELEQRQRWIPVENELPEEGVPVLVTNRKAVKPVVTAAVLYWEEDGRVWHQHCKGPLTHTASYEYIDDAEYADWQSLPPPPEGK